MTFITWFNKSALHVYLQEHVMFEHYASDYELVGPEKVCDSLHDSHLTIFTRIWRYHIDGTTTVKNR